MEYHDFECEILLQGSHNKKERVKGVSLPKKGISSSVAKREILAIFSCLCHFFLLQPNSFILAIIP
jgi:hypothetical protein